MNNKKSLSEGEALLLLVRRSGKSGIEVANEVFNVPLSAFDVVEQDAVSVPDMVAEPEPKYVKGKVEEMSAAEVFRYLEEKDRRHYEERARLLGIIENLTKPK